MLVDFDASLPINAVPGGHAGGAQVRVAVLSAMGDPIPGFRIGDCKPMYQSGVHEVSWGNADLRKLQGQRIRLRFQFRHAALYSFQFKD